jgi:hypothetical protein
MNTRIVGVIVCVAIGHASVASAADPATKGAEGRSTLTVRARPVDGPLLKASQDGSRLNLRDERGVTESRTQTSNRSDRPWVERHPVWTGALIGFGAGFGLTFLASDNNSIVGPTGPALVWGGLGAGIGALAGWGISRNDD